MRSIKSHIVSSKIDVLYYKRELLHFGIKLERWVNANMPHSDMPVGSRNKAYNITLLHLSSFEYLLR